MIERLNAALERLGVAGVIALGVLCLDAALAVSGVLPLRERLAQAQERSRVAAARSAATPAASAARDPLDRLLAVFPPPARLPEELARLFRLAEEHQVQLLQGDYRLEPFGSLLQVYRISLPVKGGYPQVRAFLAAALNAMPFLALDSIRFERQRIGDASVETQLNFSLFLANPDRGGASVSNAK